MHQMERTSSMIRSEARASQLAEEDVRQARFEVRPVWTLDTHNSMSKRAKNEKGGRTPPSLHLDWGVAYFRSFHLPIPTSPTNPLPKRSNAPGMGVANDSLWPFARD